MTEQKSPDDRRLIEAARNGDERAFEELYLRYRHYVLILAARFGAAGPDGLDVLQETFIYFFRKLPRLELKARFSTFLYPTVKHLSLKRKGLQKKTVYIENGHPIPEAVAAEGPDSQRKQVAHIVHSLPAEQREVIMLRFVDGFSLKEIALALDIPLGTVKSRLHNALAALRREND